MHRQPSADHHRKPISQGMVLGTRPISAVLPLSPAKKLNYKTGW